MKTDAEIRAFFNDTINRLGWTVDENTIERFIEWLHNNEENANPCPLYQKCIGDKCWMWVKTLDGINGHPDDGMCGVKSLNTKVSEIIKRLGNIEGMLGEMTK